MKMRRLNKFIKISHIYIFYFIPIISFTQNSWNLIPGIGNFTFIDKPKFILDNNEYVLTKSKQNTTYISYSFGISSNISIYKNLLLTIGASICDRKKIRSLVSEYNNEYFNYNLLLQSFLIELPAGIHWNIRKSANISLGLSPGFPIFTFETMGNKTQTIGGKLLKFVDYKFDLTTWIGFGVKINSVHRLNFRIIYLPFNNYIFSKDSNSAYGLQLVNEIRIFGKKSSI